MSLEHVMAQLQGPIGRELLLQPAKGHGQPGVTGAGVNQELARFCLACQKLYGAMRDGSSVGKIMSVYRYLIQILFTCRCGL